MYGEGWAGMVVVLLCVGEAKGALRAVYMWNKHVPSIILRYGDTLSRYQLQKLNLRTA